MISSSKKTTVRKGASMISTNSVKLLALILKKGKRDTTNFRKSFGKDPDFPSVDTIRKTAWK